MQEETMDRRGPSHAPRCTTAFDDRRTARMAVRDNAVISRIITQQIQSDTHQVVFVHTIRRRLQQSGMSARHPLLRLPLTGNHRLRTTNSAMKVGYGQRDELALCLLTNYAFPRNIMMVGLSQWCEAAELLGYTPPH
ncbi:transposable element Tc1 transposase [Trichonephila clavipes]|nr:transposable element Tc1 transposase [Trichonephila clavipes]